jgi:hypothetical protein
MKILVLTVFCGIFFQLLVAAPTTDSVPQTEIKEDSTATPQSSSTKIRSTTNNEDTDKRENQRPAPKTVCFEQRDSEGTPYMHCETEDISDSGSSGTSLYPSYSPPASSYGGGSSSGYSAPPKVRN